MTLTQFSDELINTWLEDGQCIREYYSQLVAKEGLKSARSIGERDEKRDFRVFERLFEKVSISSNCSILDIGCGKGELLDYLSSRFPNISYSNYLGIDIVPAFIPINQQKVPSQEFKLVNFIDPSFTPENKFDIVLALGVLVTRVRHYECFVEYFVQKMVKCAKKYVLFNVISYIEPSSSNYSDPLGVGHSTVLDTKTLHSIIDNVCCYKWLVEPYNIFPDATDLFVQIQLEQ
ncbi:methyltransferase [Scytonema sp. UIC 10036]|uniref:class I SAM-dependent methyltransferase n=1 Tax=Scytonema sp. UIC 10036 TaxID=2304196 RepID=UPI0012DAA790|nr:class I SAM-dependent methyltransferase [Scytonema sp. UIC 10036]MUG95414.1 methyltransferase [Scytonema sp. UIC 10036]